MSDIYQGQSVPLTITVDGITLSDCTNIWITLKSVKTGVQYTKSLGAGTLTVSAQVISVPFTQTETKELGDGEGELQFVYKTSAGVQPTMTVNIDIGKELDKTIVG